MKNFNGELNFRDHLILILITVMTFILPPLLFQPRKITPSPKVQRKTPAIIAKYNTFAPPGLKEQFYYHDPEVFLNGNDAYSFARFRIQEHNPEYLLKEIGALPELLKSDENKYYPYGELPHTRENIFSTVLRENVAGKNSSVAPMQKKWTYPLLFNMAGEPVPDCKISLKKNSPVPLKPTKLQVNIPALEQLGGFLHAEILASCGDVRMDRLAQNEVNRYLLKNSSAPWQNGGILTVYWGQNVKAAPMPEETETTGARL